MKRIATLVASAAFAAAVPLSVSTSPADGIASPADLVRLNTACAQVEEGEVSPCKFNLLYICEDGDSDRRWNRNRTAEELEVQ